MKLKSLLTGLIFFIAAGVFSGEANAACISSLPGTPVSVTNCGADNTGVVAADLAFQAAFAESASSGNSSKSVFIPCGTYLITSVTLYVPVDGFTLQGESGCAVTVVLPDNYNNPSGLLYIAGRTSVSIRNFKIMSPTLSGALAIQARPFSGTLSNLTISGMTFQNIGSALIAGSLDSPAKISDGVFISDSQFLDIRGYPVVLENVSGFKFTGNTVTNWGNQSTGGTDAVSYDMTTDISNWVITGNHFKAGVGTFHAISQGPDHPERQIHGLVLAGNASTAVAGGQEGRGAGFAMECSDCQILDNTFGVMPGALANGWGNCLEIYGSSNITIAGNKCDAGMLLTGPTVTRSDITGLRIYNNKLVSSGSLPGVTMTCLMFGAAGNPQVRTGLTTAKNIEIVGNDCDATAAGTDDGVVGIAIGSQYNPGSDDKITWGKIENLLVAGNKINQVAMNQALRIYMPVNEIKSVVITNNIAPQGFGLYNPGLTTTFSNNFVTKNNFGGHPTAYDNSANLAVFSFTENY